MVVADKVGRRPVILIGLVIHLIINLLLVGMVFNSIYFLFVYMALLGIRAPMASHAALVLLNEFGLPRNRSYLTMASTIFDNGSSLLLPVYFYFFQDWRGLIWINTVIVFGVLLVVLFYIPEAPRFHQSHHNFKKAREVYSFLAKRNNRKMFT